VSTLYNTIMRQVAHRLDALVSDDPTSMETHYTANPLTMTDLNDPLWTLHPLADAILTTQLKLIEAIGDTANHPYRADYTQPSAVLTSGSLLPKVIGTAQILGTVWGDVRDATSNKIVTPRTLRVIQRYNDHIGAGGYHAPSWAYHYCMQGARIYHTRDGVTIDAVCFDNAPEIAAVLSSTGVIKVRDSLGIVLFWGTTSILAAAENAAMPQAAGVYGAAFASAIDNIKQGVATIDPTSGPAPPVVPKARAA
jgi:hypothetical protein